MPVLTVAPGSDPVRLDTFLARHVPGCSRRIAQRAIAAGTVRINDRRAHKSATVAADDRVEVADTLYEPVPLCANPKLMVPVLYEDAAIIALDKPPGMAAHALQGHETDTIANFLLARYPETAEVGKGRLEPGIVHRLDTDTSGVLVAARTREAYDALRRQFVARRVIKEYRAIVHGNVALPGEVRAWVGHARHNRKKMQVCREDQGRPALTTYRPFERRGGYTMLAVEIRTGVRHQIRVHLASMGHPVVGDRLYGVAPVAAAPPRHLLHACRVELAHPSSGVTMQITSPIPDDFAAFLDVQNATGLRG